MFRRALLFGAVLAVLQVIPAKAQIAPSAFGEEPMPDQLGAPLYPGAEFIRLIDTIDTGHITAMYISMVPFNMVEDFFKRKLTERRIVMYDDKDLYLTAFLLKTWSQFPTDPTREEIELLQHEPSVQIQYYDPNEYESLAEYFDEREGGEIKALTIREGKTMILYTYARSNEPTGAEKLIGAWRETSRDLDGYWNTTITFNADGTYVYEATADNIPALARDPFIKAQFSSLSEQEIAATMHERNPERGTYAVMGTTISLESDNPLDGVKRKSGLVDVGTVSLSLELVQKPRLTFIKSR